MDAQARQSLARLIRTQRIAALGTTSDTAPLVTMVLYVAAFLISFALASVLGFMGGVILYGV